jgi:hypothetical protein
MSIVGWVVISESGVYGPFAEAGEAGGWLAVFFRDVGQATIKPLLEARKPATPRPPEAYKVGPKNDPYWWRGI